MKLIRNKVRAKFQTSWDIEIDNLHIVKPTLAGWESNRQKERLTEIILCRLRMIYTSDTYLSSDDTR